jgi:hypothetical protein
MNRAEAAAMDRRDHTRICLVVLVVLTLAYFAPLWTHPTELVHSKHSDIINQHYPWRMFAISSWKATGSLPLWTPYCFSGQPFQADAQTTLFYPPHLIFYVVPLSWVAPLFGFLLWAHVIAAGLSMFVYARHRDLQPFAALVAAVGFMFAGKWLLHLIQAGHYVFVPLAWFPWLLLCAERAIQRRRLRYAIAAGVLGAVIYTGSHPQLTLYMSLLVGILSLCAAVSSRPTAIGGIGWWLLTGVVGGCVTAGLAAVQLLPSLELAAATNRAAQITPQYGDFYDWTIHNGRDCAWRLLSLVGPQYFSGNPWEDVGAFGVLWAGVAVLAVALCRRRTVWLHAAMLVLMVVFALGPSTPVYPWLREHVPLLALFRIPSRLLLFAGFPLGLLAGHLTQHLFASRAVPRPALVWAAALLGIMVYLYFLASLDTSPPEYRYWWWVLTLGPALAGVLVVHSLASGRWPLLEVACRTAWLAVLAADLWGIHHHWLRTRPVADIYPENDALRFLARHPGSYRVADRPLNDGQPTFSALTNALCYLHGIEWVRGLNVTDLHGYKQFLNYVAGQEGPPVLNEIPVLGPIRNQQLLDLLAVRYLISPAKLSLTASERAAWRPVATLTDNRVHQEADSRRGGMHELAPFTIYERTRGLPRAFVVSDAHFLPAKADPLDALSAFDLRQTVLLDSPQSFWESPTLPTPGTFQWLGCREATVVQHEPNRVVVDVNGGESGYLILLETWYPGWKCETEDGQELPLWQADTLFRAVPLPPGEHRLTFRFAPASYRAGWTISVAMGVLLVGVTVLATLRGSRRCDKTNAAKQSLIRARLKGPPACSARQRALTGGPFTFLHLFGGLGDAPPAGVTSGWISR